MYDFASLKQAINHELTRMATNGCNCQKVSLFHLQRIFVNTREQSWLLFVSDLSRNLFFPAHPG